MHKPASTYYTRRDDTLGSGALDRLQSRPSERGWQQRAAQDRRDYLTGLGVIALALVTIAASLYVALAVDCSNASRIGRVTGLDIVCKAMF